MKIHHPKTPDELRRNFRHAFEALELSSKAYDEGHKGEAARLAGVIYVYVHDYGRNNVSLLTHVGRKSIPFCNTARPINPRNKLTEAPLTLLNLSSAPPSEAALNEEVYVPRLGQPTNVTEPELKFTAWWEAGILKDKKNRILTRKNLITFMRHNEGGGHVSGTFDEYFAGLRRENTGGWSIVRNAQAVAPAYGPEYASTRQIAYEVRETLVRHCQELLG